MKKISIKKLMGIFLITLSPSLSADDVRENKNTSSITKYLLGGEYADNKMINSSKKWMLIPVSGEEDTDDMVTQYYAMTESEKGNSTLVFSYRGSSYCQLEYRYYSDKGIQVKTLNSFFVDNEKVSVNTAKKLLSVLSKGKNLTTHYKNIEAQQQFSLAGSSKILKTAIINFSKVPATVCNTWEWKT